MAAGESLVKSDAISRIRVKRPLLHRALDAGKIDAGVKVSVEIAAELNAPKLQVLSPKDYYEVYLAVSEELQIFGSVVVASARSGRTSVVDLYEKVQYTEHVTPRLYLLITIGSALVTTKQTLIEEVMSDLLTMCSAVQNPIRGLFLRNYYAQVC
mmetsp:Transcript_15148/g.62086  ORF Transcript_15148/g.62086 Transcript_15148/m.62086 type:complete len:155 (-) Transcript_15148:3627-4091(-)